MIAQSNNPHKSASTSFFALISSVILNRELIMRMVSREVVGRYRGSLFGIAWSFLNPIVMLVTYTFVFSVVFKARWGDSSSESRTQFALLLFVGMIIFGLFSEVVNRAPGLIVSNVNYVKKVIFPLEILPVISLGAALFHFFVSFLVLTIAIIVVDGHLSWTIIYLPAVMLPLILIIMGISWALASFGVYLRDISQTIGIFTTILMFLSPVFYPVSALPDKFQGWMLLNPLTFIIEQARAIIIFGKQPDWYGLGVYALFSIGIVWLGYFWFQKTRKGFADVL